MTEPLSSLDLSFLSIENARTPMHFGGLAVLGRAGPGHHTRGDIDGATDGQPAGPVDEQALVALLRERAGSVAVLRRRLRAQWLPFAGASWAPDPDFDVTRHVHAHRTVGQGGTGELGAWVARMMAGPMPRDRPMWEIHVLGGLAGGGAAMLMKVHHALADGMRAIEIAGHLFDGGRAPRADPPTTEAQGSLALARRLLAPLAPVTDPGALAHSAVRTVGTVASVAQAMSRPAPGLPFEAPVGPRRAFAMSRIEMSAVHRLRRHYGGTAGDVLVALIAGAVRQWLVGRVHDLDPAGVRALIPVGGVGSAGGNGFSAYLLDLAVEEPEPARRLASIIAGMTRNRSAGPAGGPGAVGILTNQVPSIAVRLAGPLLATQANRLFDMLITHVPLPRPLTLGGVAVTEAYPVAPLAQGQPIGVAISTYRGIAHVGINADPVLVPDLAELAAAVPAALNELAIASGQPPSRC